MDETSCRRLSAPREHRNAVVGDIRSAGAPHRFGLPPLVTKLALGYTRRTMRLHPFSSVAVTPPVPSDTALHPAEPGRRVRSFEFRVARRWTTAGFVALAIGLLATPVHGQLKDTARFGISVGGISTVGVVVEYIDEHGSTELNVGTWSFRDLSISLVRRHYLGVARVRPSVGLGLWGVLGFPPEGRASAALVVRAPIGVDAETGNGHAFTADVNLNRGLWIRRSDPDDDLPMSQRLIPLPGASYRWRNR